MIIYALPTGTVIAMYHEVTITQQEELQMPL